MTCYHPLHGFRARSPSKNGKFGIVFNPKHGYVDMPLTVPCGQCRGCRFERSRQWAMRCEHEAKLHARNCFITLTYAPEFLPPDGSLDVEVFQKFMKRLRKKVGPVRFYHCGEYGEKHRRPHYHACIFGYDFPDRRYHKTTAAGFKLYTSEILESIWADPKTGRKLGHATIGDVTFESAGYVARYVMKKINGDLAAEHYQRSDPTTGEVTTLKPEYTTMSRRPGIGKGWYDKFKSDVYPADACVVRGRQMKPPRFYDNHFEIEHPEVMQEIKAKRLKDAKKHVDNNTPDRLAVRETVMRARTSTLRRDLE